jgi:spore coat polysaccharide biosynthesis protein SpsF
MFRLDRQNVTAIVQARMKSERFPGKMVADLCGKPVVEHVLNQLSKVRGIDQIVLASPDKELVDIATNIGAWGYHDIGDPNNVLSRYIKCANWCNAEIVVRITADCPLIQPEIVENVINGYLENRVDISTNVLRRTYAKGMDVEVLHRNTLKRMNHLTDDPHYREHVTLFAYENPSLFKFYSVLDKDDYSRFNVSVDTPNDLDRLNKILGTVDSVNYKQIVDWFIKEGY